MIVEWSGDWDELVTDITVSIYVDRNGIWGSGGREYAVSVAVDGEIRPQNTDYIFGTKDEAYESARDVMKYLVDTPGHFQRFM